MAEFDDRFSFGRDDDDDNDHDTLLDELAEGLADFVHNLIKSQITVERIADVGRNDPEHIALVRVAQRETQCCEGESYRDGVIVAAPTEAMVTSMRPEQRASARQTVLLIGVDEHTGETMRLSMDLASIDALGKHCAEVAAFVRQRNMDALLTAPRSADEPVH